MIGAHVVWDQRFTSYDFGPGHPMHPSRLDLTLRLARELGLLDGPDVQVGPARQATDAELHTVHAVDYVRAVRALSREPGAAHGQWGLGTEDTPAFAGMHEASSLAVGATLEACEQVWSGQAGHAVNVAGGLHHAMPAGASGFCIYNDIAVGIAWLREQGARVAYVDLDVHHGDGVERAFWDDRQVLTVSVHESGRALFPGTGFPGDTGGPHARDHAVNVALPPGTGDEGWLRAVDAVVPAVVERFAPDVLVTQHGCDGHVSDPLAHLALSVDGMSAAAGWMHDLAHRVCDGRWVALGGGGYELVDVVPLAWSHVIGQVVHRPVALTADVPPGWREYVSQVYGRTAPRTMGDRAGIPIDYGDWQQGYQPEAPVDAAIMATRTAVFPGWGMDQHFD